MAEEGKNKRKNQKKKPKEKKDKEEKKEKVESESEKKEKAIYEKEDESNAVTITKTSYIPQKLVIAGIFFLVIILAFNTYYSFNLENELDSKMLELKEQLKTPELEMIKITTSLCPTGCFEIDKIAGNLKNQQDIKIVNEKTVDGSSSKEGKNLVFEYGIKKLPTIILRGDINRTSVAGFKKEKDALIFDKIKPPYVDVTNQKVSGKVSIITIGDKSCDMCPNFNVLIQNLEKGGVFIDKKEELDIRGPEGIKLIKKFNIQKVPVILISDDISVYPEVSKSLEQANVKKIGGYYTFESNAPYVETNTGKVRGLVSLLMLTDSSCKKCYDVTLHKQILARFGMAISEEKKVDVNSSKGLELVNKYNISKVPTVILTGDLNAYSGFKSIWKQVGSVESDGAYIFRKIEVLDKNIVYRNLTTLNGSIVSV